MSADRVPVFDIDPELAELVPSVERDAARSAALVAVRELSIGRWEPDGEPMPAGGFLVLHGCLSREVSVLGDMMAVDFLAHGDVLHPSIEPVMTSVPAGASWSVLEPTRLAVLDAAFLISVQSWPQVSASLLRRQERRCNWLAHVLAISHLPRIEMRILVLFWLFADRWGHRTGSGVQVPIPLTHVNIARLIGAQRPTVTTALHHLIDAGHLAHGGNGHWTLRRDPPDRLRQ